MGEDLWLPKTDSLKLSFTETMSLYEVPWPRSLGLSHQILQCEWENPCGVWDELITKYMHVGKVFNCFGVGEK